MTPCIALLGYACGFAAQDPDCALGPWYVFYHPEIWINREVSLEWRHWLFEHTRARGKQALEAVAQQTQQLADHVYPLAQQHKPFCVIGGDHSCAIGTWSAVAYANRAMGDIGLIWIDAHMDSHTPETSRTQNIHGMPVAVLLGHGDPALCQLMDSYPKLKPKNMCLIGVRSYEPEEVDLLKRLGVKTYGMQEVKQRGIAVVLQEACDRLSQTTCGLGLSIDMDAIDPTDAPGVGYRESGGIHGEDLCTALQHMKPERPLLGLELSELNPIRDDAGKTAILMLKFLDAVCSHWFKPSWRS